MCYSALSNEFLHGGYSLYRHPSAPILAQSDGEDPAQPTSKQRPVPLRLHPLEVLRPLPDLIPPVELIPGERGWGLTCPRSLYQSLS